MKTFVFLALAIAFGGNVASGQTELIALDANWRYLNPVGNNENPEVLNPTFVERWFGSDFDDSSWEGPEPGPFLYGSVGAINDSETVLLDPPEGERFTNYFRTSFTLAEPASGLAVNLLADDGAFVYIDGVQVLRYNCCEDAATEDRYEALTNWSGRERFFREIRLDPDLTLSAGEHSIAVSVHQLSSDSSDMGLGIQLLRDVPPPDVIPGSITITAGNDASIIEADADATDSTGSTWEWDGSDDDGVINGLAKFDIPEDTLANFGNGRATLQLLVTNGGEPANVYRMTSDWLSGENGGDNVTWNNIADGPGVVPGTNAALDPSAEVPGSSPGDVLSLDVSADVQAWSDGAPNFGWAFLPLADTTDGVSIESFEFDGVAEKSLVLILEPEAEGLLGDFNGDAIRNALDLDLMSLADGDLAFDLDGNGSVNLDDRIQWVEALENTYFGDANLDGEFNSTDLVTVFQAGQYEDLIEGNSGWSDGDWNGDLEFDSGDLVLAFASGGFEVGPRNAVASVPEPSGWCLLCIGIAFVLTSGGRTDER